MVAVGVAPQPSVPLVRQVSLWLLSLVPEEVVLQPDELLEHPLKASGFVLGEDSTLDQRLLLVAILAQRAVDDQEREWTGDNIPVSALREERPRLQAILALGDRWPPHRLAACTSRFLYVVAWIDRFAQAIAPRTLESVLRDTRLAEHRLRCFLDSRKLSDMEMRLRARNNLARLVGPQTDLDAFLDWLPISRLRSYPPDMLRQVAEHWLTWSPLVECLRGRCQASDDIEVRLKREVLDRILRLLRPSLSGAPWFGRDDAVQEAILSEIQAPPEREGDYCYEVEYPFWLARAASNRLRSRQRRHRTQVLQEDRAGVFDNTEALDTLRKLEWRSRIALVLSFFQPQVQCRVKAIVDWAILNSSGSARLTRDAEAGDAALASYVARSCGEQVALKTLATTRYRLRQRLEVLRFIRDRDNDNTPPGDVALRAWIEERWGWADADEPTLRHLAALARAATAERNLGWALFARWLVDTNAYDADKAFTELELFLRNAGPGKDEIDRRLRVARSWQVGAPARRAWTDICYKVRGAGMSFLLSPCWLLVILGGIGVEQVVTTLLPEIDGGGSAEEDCIRTVAAALLRVQV